MTFAVLSGANKLSILRPPQRRTTCLAPGGWGGLTISRTDAAPFQIYSLDISSIQAYSATIVANTLTGQQSKVVNLPGPKVRYATAILDLSDVKSLTITWYDGLDGQGRVRAGDVDNIFLNTHNVPKVADPVASKPSGVYSGPFAIQLTCATPGAEIFYSTSNTPPVYGTNRYAGGDIGIVKTGRIRAWAHVPGMLESDMPLFDYCIGKPVPPAITENPHDMTVKEGQSTTIMIKISGQPSPDVQWQKKYPGEADFRDVPGANGTSITAGVTTADSGSGYRAIITNMAGKVISEPVTVTVVPK